MSTATVANQTDFSDVELDFFKRGDDLHPPSDEAPAGDSVPDADA